MKYVILLALLMLSLAPHVNGLTLYEKNLAENGFEGLTLNESNQTTCTTITFDSFPGYLGDGNDTLLTLRVNTIPLTEADANIFLFARASTTPFLVSNSRSWNGSSTIHLLIDPVYQEEETTTLRLCATSSPSTELIHVSSDAKIGLYQQPRFDEPGSFQTRIVGENPTLGEEIGVQVYLYNHGAQPAHVRIDYRKYELNYVPLLKGETGYEGIIQPGEEKTLTYSIKPLRAVSILLPPAILSYTNIFGEPEVRESSRPFLLVEDPAFDVKGAFLTPQTRIAVNDPLSVQWVVQNEGITPVNQLRADFSITPNGPTPPPSILIETLSPSKADTSEFTLTFNETGIYTLGCTLRPENDSTLTSQCQRVVIEVVEGTNALTLFFSILLLTIAIAVYAYIYILPSRPSVEPPSKKGRFQSG